MGVKTTLWNAIGGAPVLKDACIFARGVSIPIARQFLAPRGWGSGRAALGRCRPLLVLDRRCKAR